jgi:NAD+ kinase
MIGIHAAADREGAVSTARRLVELADAAGIATSATGPETAAAVGVPVVGGPLRAVVAVGGDGTVLEGAVHALERGAPLVGINVGRVGFLAEVEPDELGLLIDVLAGDELPTTPRMGIRARLGDIEATGLNDVVVQKTDGQHMVGVDVGVDGERFLTYRADGVVVSTPTGSSAYTLSAGGPLVDTRVGAFVVTPVAPYSLFRSSVVLDPGATITCTVIHDRPASVAVDGRELGIAMPGDAVEITRGPEIPFVDIAGRSYPETLKRKLRLHEGLDGVLGGGRA